MRLTLAEKIPLCRPSNDTELSSNVEKKVVDIGCGVGNLWVWAIPLTCPERVTMTNPPETLVWVRLSYCEHFLTVVGETIGKVIGDETLPDTFGEFSYPDARRFIISVFAGEQSLPWGMTAHTAEIISVEGDDDEVIETWHGQTALTSKCKAHGKHEAGTVC